MIHIILLTVYFWIMATLTTIFTTIVCVCSYPFLEQKSFTRLYEYLIGTLMLKTMTIPGFWSIKVTDLRENKTFNDRYIFIANHASFIDTILCAQIPATKKFIMNAIFTKVPLFGQLCLMSGHVPVYPKDKNSSKNALNKSIVAMEDGSSFMVYPEGTRSDNPYKLLPFKTGAFRLAQQANINVLPMILKGTGVAMPIGGICYPANLEIIICNPISVGTDWEDIQKAKDKSSNLIQNHLNVGINGEKNFPTDIKNK